MYVQCLIVWPLLITLRSKIIYDEKLFFYSLHYDQNRENNIFAPPWTSCYLWAQSIQSRRTILDQPHFSFDHVSFGKYWHEHNEIFKTYWKRITIDLSLFIAHLSLRSVEKFLKIKNFGFSHQNFHSDYIARLGWNNPKNWDHPQFEKHLQKSIYVNEKRFLHYSRINARRNVSVRICTCNNLN